jgi:gluconate 5-dehydrogenase
MSNHLFDLTGRIALVTGSARGIGSAIARGLADAGAIVVLNGRNEQALEQARAELADAIPGAPVHAAAFDASDSDAVRAAVDRIGATIGAIDILVNNVGTQARAPITEVDDATWDRLVATNLSSALYLSRAVAPAMIERGAGKIVNVCSLQSDLARPGIAPYAATKGGLKMLTKGLCADLAPHGIQVNAIGPGYFDTELTQPLVADPAFYDWIVARTPAARWGRVDDLVGSAIFLASPAADFVNGQLLYVDGGLSAVL